MSLGNVGDVGAAETPTHAAAVIACLENFEANIKDNEKLIDHNKCLEYKPSHVESVRARGIEPRGVATPRVPTHGWCFCCRSQARPKFAVTLHWDGDKIKEYLEHGQQVRAENEWMTAVDVDPGFWDTHSMKSTCPGVCGLCIEVLREEGTVPREE